MGALALEPHGSQAPASPAPRYPAPYSALTRGAFYALRDWAREGAPASSPTGRKIFEVLAKHADPDGCNAFPSVPTIAALAECCDRTVQRHLDALREHGSIVVATDPHPPAYLEYMKHVRGTPATRYEIMMPASAYDAGPPGRLEQINRYRAERWGKDPITPESRPDLAPWPRRERAASPGVDRRRKSVRAGEAEAAALALEVPPPSDEDAPPLEPAPLEVPPAPVVRVVVDPAEAPPLTDEDAPPLEDGSAPRGDTVSPLGVTESHARGAKVTPNPLTGTPPIDPPKPAPLAVVENVSGFERDRMRENPVPAVGDQAEVVRGRARAARAGGKGSKRARGQATPRRPRNRPLWTVTAEAVEVYRVAIPAQVKAYVPDHATGRILGAVTAELARQAEAFGCPAVDEVAQRIAERAEAWRYRMTDAADPVAVVIGAIVRGPVWAPVVRPWCGGCEGPTPARRFRTRENGNLMRCPDCHPLDAPPPHDDLGGRPAAALDEAGKP